MTDTQLEPAAPRRMTRYTVCAYKQVYLDDGQSITARVDIQLAVPHDAVLETSLQRINVQAKINQPHALPFERVVNGRATRNLEEAPP